MRSLKTKVVTTVNVERKRQVLFTGD